MHRIVWLIFLLPLWVGAQTSPPATEPASRPANPREKEIESQIEKLGDPDAQVRKDAGWRIREIGRAAIGALREAVNSPSPQVRLEAESALKALDRPPIPDGSRGPHEFRAVSYNDTSSICEIVDGRRVIRVEQVNSDAHHPNTDIVMRITGPVDGKPTTQVIKAQDPEHLKWEAPEAWKIYHRHFNPEDDRKAISAVHDDLEAAIHQRLDHSNLAQEQRKAVLAQLKRFVDASNEEWRAIVMEPDKGPKTLAESYRQSDKLRQMLTELHFPPLPIDAEQQLELPPRSRLGVYVTLDPKEFPHDYTSGLVVEFAAAGSRAEKIGLKPLDIIEQINDKPMDSMDDLRPAVEACETGMVIQVLRDGQRTKLTEK